MCVQGPLFPQAQPRLNLDDVPEALRLPPGYWPGPWQNAEWQ